MSAVSPSPGRFSPERKTPPSVSAPSVGLRPLNVSRVKCRADLVAATKSFREREIRYAFNAPLLRNCGRFDISLPETRSGATGPSPFKVGDNQRPERTMSGVRKPSPESSVPCTIDSGRIPRSRRVPPSTYKKPLDLELTSRCILIKTYEAEYQRRFQHGI